MSFIRRHALPLGALALGLLFVAAFTLGQWQAFVSQEQHQHEVAHFWSWQFAYVWLVQMASNLAAECLGGIVLLVVLADIERGGRRGQGEQ